MGYRTLGAAEGRQSASAAQHLHLHNWLTGRRPRLASAKGHLWGSAKKIMSSETRAFTGKPTQGAAHCGGRKCGLVTFWKLLHELAQLLFRAAAQTRRHYGHPLGLAFPHTSPPQMACQSEAGGSSLPLRWLANEAGGSSPKAAAWWTSVRTLPLHGCAGHCEAWNLYEAEPWLSPCVVLT